MKRAYVAGAMDGQPLFNAPLFLSAKQFLASLDIDATTPVELNEKEGWTQEALLALSKEEYRKVRAYLLVTDLLFLHKCDYVFILPNSEGSEGTLLESMYMLQLGSEVYQLVAVDNKIVLAYNILTKEPYVSQ